MPVECSAIEEGSAQLYEMLWPVQSAVAYAERDTNREQHRDLVPAELLRS